MTAPQQPRRTSLALNPPGSPPPAGQYSNAAVVPAGEGTVWIAGQLPLDGRGELVSDDFEEQAEVVFEQLAGTLDGVGSSLADVAFLRTFLVRAQDLPAFRDVRSRVFQRHGVNTPPPATTVVVQALVGQSLIELDAVAVPTQPR